MNKVTAKKIARLVNELKQVIDADGTVLKITITNERPSEPVVELKRAQDVDVLKKRMVVARGAINPSHCYVTSWMESVEFSANPTVLQLREAGFDVPGEGERADAFDYVIER